MNKWEVLRQLATARSRFGLTDRDMTVLQALVSFHPGAELGQGGAPLVVHPSNESICERLNGMPCSTMRRHLAHLVNAGIILRRDSPNGKRYVRRHGDNKVAFGFDLSPLHQRSLEFRDAADAVRAALAQLKSEREAISLMRRDLANLVAYGQTAHPQITLWDRLFDLAVATAKDLRRKLSLDQLHVIAGRLRAALSVIQDILDPAKPKELSSDDDQNEQHYQNSKEDSYESEQCFEIVKPASHTKLIDTPDTVQSKPRIPFSLVLKACRQIQIFSPDQINHWHDLVRAADKIIPMLGITASAWDDAREKLGAEQAAVVVSAILERFSTIHSPGGYLRTLANKAALGKFTCGPMIMALLSQGSPIASSQL